jgi:hypothetical protein
MTRLILLTALVTALLIVCDQHASAMAARHTYYVAPTGNDANPGTLSRPWQTIQKAASTLVAGDTVYIRAGTYHERVAPQHSGSEGNFITYAAYPGETATIDGAGITLPDDLAGLFEIAGRSHIRLSGLRVINAGPFANNAAILVSDSGHISIENCATFRTASSGIGVWGSQRIVVAGNTVERAGTGGGQECITIAGTSNFEVRDNTVLDCQKEGIDAKDGSSNGLITRNVVNRPRAVGIYVDAWDKPTHDITVSRNLVFDSVESAGFAVASEMGGLLANIRLENNIAYRNHTYGIEISYCCSGSHPMDTIVIINNTLYGNGVGWGGGIIADNAQAQHVVIRNNIASQNLTFQIAVAADVPAGYVTVDYNLVDGYRGYEDEVYGEDYVEGNPRFVDAAAVDFHLRPDSPAIDRGSPQAAPANDFDGNPRPRDGDGDGAAGHDIGAYEVPSPRGTPSPTATHTATPTRTVASRPLYLPLILKLAAANTTPTPTPTATRTPTPTITSTPGDNTPTPTRTPTPTATPTLTTGLCPGPEPAFVTDLQVRQPPALAEPAPRVPSRDPVFGRCVVRVTDRTRDKAEPGGLKNEYSRVQSFNAGETRLPAWGAAGGPGRAYAVSASGQVIGSAPVTAGAGGLTFRWARSIGGQTAVAYWLPNPQRVYLPLLLRAR